MEEKKFNRLLEFVEDTISDLLYYQRKECDDVTTKDTNSMTNEQYDKLSEKFKEEIEKLKN